MESAVFDHGGMPRPLGKKVRRHTPTPIKPLYLGAWIRKLGYRPAEVARGTGLNEGYLSQLISGKKTNPSRVALAAIAEFLDVHVAVFDSPPPDQPTLDTLSRLDPQLLARLMRRH